MERRKFLKGATLTAGAATTTTLAAPAVAQSRIDLVIVSTWGRDFPGLGLSAQRLAARITELSEGRIVTQYFAAGERVGDVGIETRLDDQDVTSIGHLRRHRRPGIYARQPRAHSLPGR